MYRAWNTAIKKATCEYIIFLNSDFAFSDNWSEILKKNITENSCVCSRLIERGIMDGGLVSGKYGLEKSFGRNVHNYREKDFNNFVKQIQTDEIKEGGLFMPLLIKKEYLEKINYYPEGNVLEDSDIFNPIYATIDDIYNKGKKCISGDKILMQKLRHINIQHYTIFNSIVYHFQEGEMKSNIFDTEFHFYGYNCQNLNITKPIYIYYSNDGRMRTEFEFFDRTDGWLYSQTINTFINKDNCNKYYIYRVKEDLTKNIYENTILSKIKPKIFLINSNYNFIDVIFLKIYIPNINNLENCIKYYYCNTQINIINEY